MGQLRFLRGVAEWQADSLEDAEKDFVQAQACFEEAFRQEQTGEIVHYVAATYEALIETYLAKKNGPRALTIAKKLRNLANSWPKVFTEKDRRYFEELYRRVGT